MQVPFALTAGLSGTNSSRLVVIAGLAELVSGAISMGVGGFLSAQAEVDHYKYQMATTRKRLTQTCNSQVEREVYDILGPYGVPQDEAGRVAKVLQRAEQDQRDLDEAERQQHGTMHAATRRFRALAHLPVLGTLWDRDHAHAQRRASSEQTGVQAQEGLSVFLLRVGEGVEPVAKARMYISALVIGISYFLGESLTVRHVFSLRTRADALLLLQAAWFR